MVCSNTNSAKFRTRTKIKFMVKLARKKSLVKSLVKLLMPDGKFLGPI